MKASHSFIWRVLLGLVCAFLAGSSALADFSLGDASNYAVLGVSLTTSSINETTINGNIGIGHGGTLTLNPPGSIRGNIDFLDPIVTSGSNKNFTQNGMTVTGHILGTVGQVATADSAAKNLSTFAAGEAATITSITNISLQSGQTKTIAASAGKDGNTVIHLSNLVINNGTLTLTGKASDYFIFDITGNVQLSGGAIRLKGVAADHVLFNIEGTGADVDTSGDGTYHGIFLADQRDFNLSDSIITGRVFGASDHKLNIVEGFTLNQPAPEPRSYILFAIGGVALLGMSAWRKRRRTLAA